MNNQKDFWKNIKGYEEYYQIDQFGNIKSYDFIINTGNGKFIRKGKILKPYLTSCGYLTVTLCKNGKGRAKRIHVLVWDHFGDKPRNGRILQVDHKNEIKIDCWIGNLQLLNNRQNVSKGKLQYEKSSKYTGVSWNKRDKKWLAFIYINGKHKYLGSFSDEYEAHLAYKNELKLIT